MATKDTIGEYLEGKLLMATPLTRGGCFEKAVVYVCSHNAEGAMGVVLNQVIPRVSGKDIFFKTEIGEKLQHIPLHFGGPVEPTRGFILHSLDYNGNNTKKVGDYAALTFTTDILDDIALGKGPQQMIVALGYAGWAAGQLEQEILENTWIPIPATQDLVFNYTGLNQWHAAAHSLGMDMVHYSGQVGHA